MKFHFENQLNKNITDNNHFKISESLKELDDALSNFSQKNYHHAELFYDFPLDNSYSINQNIAKQLINIKSMNFEKSDNLEDFNTKYKMYKSFVSLLIDSHNEHISIIENQINIMKSEITQYIK